ncbi:MAG TPA: tripartite tricarboxylate transporter substrate-binding protein [Xanthobacteraceae bacterium]|nr:tripartite tricarboxylate transporter substrate-binding protein [Xanthobacteraceae bacterium]
MTLRRRTVLTLVAAALAVAAGGAGAQEYPARPITLIVPFPPGGPNDTLGRIMAERMRTSLGQPVIVENISGANGTIGVGRLARATADGYTIGIGTWATHVVNPAIYALPYDTVKDFEPIALLAVSAPLIAAKLTMPADNLKELIAWLKANPDKATQGTIGPGSPPHVAGVAFQTMTGTRFRFVPYRGTAPAMQDLLSGQIDLLIDSPITSLPQVRAGRIKAYAVFAKDRYPSAPDIPTMDEAGLPGFHMSVWNALWTVKGTPPDIVAKLNAAAVEALADPAVRKRFAELGQNNPPREQQTPEALGALQRADIATWWPVVKAANIKGE